MQHRIDQIDGLRGIAALVVAAVFHLHFLLGQYRTGPLDGISVFTWLHEYGWTMVDLFFVISGFIFSHVYLTESGLSVSRRRFVAARIARLYPLHIATLIVMAVLLFFGTPPTIEISAHDPWHFLLNLLMLQESGFNEGMSFNIPAWSVGVEVLCYAAFYRIATDCRRDLLQVSTMVTLVAFLATLSDSGTVDHIARGFCGYFAGVILYRFRVIPSWPVIVALVVTYAIFPTGTGLSLGAIMSLTLWPALILLSLKSAVLSTAAFRWLGDRSYSIYLVHAPIYTAGSLFLFDGYPVSPDLWPLASVLSLGVILLSADLSYRFFETPMRRHLSQGLGGRTSADHHCNATATVARRW